MVSTVAVVLLWLQIGPYALLMVAVVAIIFPIANVITAKVRLIRQNNQVCLHPLPPFIDTSTFSISVGFALRRAFSLSLCV